MSERRKSREKIASDWASKTLRADAERGCATMLVAVPIPMLMMDLLRDDTAFNEVLQLEFRECVQRLVADKAKALLRGIAR